MVDLLNVAPCGIFSFNDEGIIIQANDTICTLVKFDKQSLIHQKVNTIFTLPTIIFYQTHLYPLLKMKDSVEEIFITLKTKEGKEIPVLLSAKRIKEEGNVENICSCLPIYNRKNYEDEIIAAKKQAEKALEENSALIDTKAKLQQQIELLDDKMFQLQRRNEELKELNNTMSHDLQEPIRKLHLFSDLLLHGGSNIPQEQTLKKITNQTLRLKQLLHGLQDWIILDNDALKISEVDLAEVLLCAEQKLSAKNPGLTIDIEANNLSKVKADREQFGILFYELLSNSVKFRSAERPLKVRIETTILNYNQFKTMQDHYQYSNH
jgi:phosphoserine phosphatase RsbU/P